MLRLQADLRWLRHARAPGQREGPSDESNRASGASPESRRDFGNGEGLVRAVDNVDLEVARGETVAVMGPSGCGKSTLLHLLGGLDRPTAGELWLTDQRIDQMSERELARLRCRASGWSSRLSS